MQVIIYHPDCLFPFKVRTTQRTIAQGCQPLASGSTIGALKGADQGNSTAPVSIGELFSDRGCPAKTPLHGLRACPITSLARPARSAVFLPAAPDGPWNFTRRP